MPRLGPPSGFHFGRRRSSSGRPVRSSALAPSGRPLLLTLAAVPAAQTTHQGVRAPGEGLAALHFLLDIRPERGTQPLWRKWSRSTLFLSPRGRSFSPHQNGRHAPAPLETRSLGPLRFSGRPRYSRSAAPSGGHLRRGRLGCGRSAPPNIRRGSETTASAIRPPLLLALAPAESLGAKPPKAVLRS